MKFKMWDSGQNPMVIPNGIPRSAIVETAPETQAALKAASGADHFWFKLGRFDPDKRWLMAVAAAAYVKRRGERVKLLMRGGREAHAAEVFNLALHQGLNVRHLDAPADSAGLSALLRDNKDADVINLTSFVDDDLVTSLYSACDAVLANSGHEPFGLVGLEVMAAGGLAVTGSTGEDYAEAYRNAVVLETDDPIEIVTELTLLKERPRLVEAMRRRGRVTARDYLWEKVIDRQLLLRVGFAAARQAVSLPSNDTPASKPGRPIRKRVTKRV
jgi:glycosyltransferase involved in cell wall biosynthesis